MSLFTLFAAPWRCLAVSGGRVACRLLCAALVLAVRGPVVGADMATVSVHKPEILRIGVQGNLPPLSFQGDHGEPDGLTIDFVRRIFDPLGLPFQIVASDGHAGVHHLIQEGGVDLIAGVSLDLIPPGTVVSRAYDAYPLVFVTSMDRPIVSGFAALAGGRLAVAADADWVRRQLTAHLPAPLDLVDSDGSLEHSMQMVVDGTADAALGDLAVVDRLIREKWAGVLKVAGPARRSVPLGIVARPGFEPLMHGINNSILQISERERQAMRNRWLSAQLVDPTLPAALRSTFPIWLPLALVCAALLVAYPILRKEVRQRKWAEAALHGQLLKLQVAQAAARESQQRLRDVTSHLPAVVYQFRQGASRSSRRLTYIAGDSRPLFGIAADDLICNPVVFSRSVDADDMDAIDQAILASARDLSTLRCEFRAAPLGQVQWIRTEASARRSDDGETIWNGYWTIITDEREREQSVRAAHARAESALRARDQFLAVMSHEIRTPMNGVLGLVEVLSKTTPLREDQRHMLGLVQDSANLLLQILNDILDFTKIEAGRFELICESFSVRAVCDHVAGLLSGRARERGIALRVTVASDVAMSLTGDPIRLRQILFNLLGNAVKFTDEGHATLRVAAENIDGAQQLTFSIEDTGIGISVEDQARLFEPFAQADASVTRRFGGTGLGLLICRRIAEAMGGFIGLDSAPGVGTRVTVRLTLPVPFAQALPEGGPFAMDAVIELDDAGLAAALRHHLMSAGVHVVASTQAARARVVPVDLLFCREYGRPPQCGARQVVYLTDGPLGPGWQADDTGVRLCANPLFWGALLDVLRYAAHPATASRLSVALPAQPQSIPGRVDPALEARAGRLVLVAEDYPINRSLVLHQLDWLGYAYHLVEDGEQALAAWRRDRYGMVLTDCHMPKLSGYQLAREIRAQEAREGRPRMPVVAFTASVPAEQRATHHWCDAGMDMCLHKPLNLDELRACLERYLPARDAASHAFGAELLVNIPPALRESLGDASVLELISTLFVPTMREDLDALEAGIQADDRVRIRDMLHRMLGSVNLIAVASAAAAITQYQLLLDTACAVQVQAAGGHLVARLRGMVATLARGKWPDGQWAART